MAKLENSNPTTEDMIWPCMCGCCYLRLMWFNDDPEDSTLWIQTFHQPVTIRKRIKSAWKSLCGREVNRQEVILDDPAVSSLHSYLESKLQVKTDIREVVATANEISRPVKIPPIGNSKFDKYIGG